MAVAEENTVIYGSGSGVEHRKREKNAPAGGPNDCKKKAATNPGVCPRKAPQVKSEEDNIFSRKLRFFT